MTRFEQETLAGNPDVVRWSSYIGQGAPRFVLLFDVQTPLPSFGQTVIVTKDLEARDRLKRKLDEYVKREFIGTDANVRLPDIGPPVGLAYAMMGGIIVGMLLTLLFLPALYVAWSRIKAGGGPFRNRASGGVERCTRLAASIDVERALADYDAAIRLKPDFAAAYYNSAQDRNLIGQGDDAIEDYRRTFELALESQEAHRDAVKALGVTL